ncbi:universal stress protein UspA [Planomonospora sphaerica]|uniref:Universal stress protein UspA n=1 Tax=Planomonospora sphaerica TaxID=161355 RepID=A0A171DPP7_9ACTN|nr:universal stress protein [Planomonospora sphaerica]GAT71028.1 universal stress protein UspA [Planomonospora sphaerica]
MNGVIVAGTDGSAVADEAVCWAVDDAARRGAPLRIVHAVEAWPYGASGFSASGTADFAVRAGERMLTEAARAAADRRPDAVVTTELVEGAPAAVLRDQATAAAELVVGSHGVSAVTGALLGSVPAGVAGHVDGAVVVVRPSMADPYGGIVVGVGDSEECEPALAFAFEQARLRGCPLRAVHARRTPSRVSEPGPDRTEDEAPRAVADRLAAWRERFPTVAVTQDMACAPPAAALVDASGRAALLVVGSRGLGAVGSLILGSVSRQVLHHARCPVAVVRQAPLRSSPAGHR